MSDSERYTGNLSATSASRQLMLFSDAGLDYLSAQAQGSAEWHLVIPLTPSFADLELWRSKLGRQYFAQLGFQALGAEVSDLDSTASNVQLAFESFSSPAPEVIQKLYIKSVRDNFLIPSAEFLGSELTDWFDSHIQASGPMSDIWLCKDADRLIAMAAFFSSTDYLNRDVRQIGWIWIEKNIRQATRSNAHAGISSLLRSNSNALFQAGIPLHNIRSQKFFNKLGFKPLCAYVNLNHLS